MNKGKLAIIIGLVILLIYCVYANASSALPLSLLQKEKVNQLRLAQAKIAPPPPEVRKSWTGSEANWIEYLRRDFTERYRISTWQSEVATPNGARCDLLGTGVYDSSPRRYAIEVEWADKKFEAVGQALFYSIAFDVSPGIILLMNGDRSNDEDYLICLAVCRKYNIRLWTQDTSKKPDGYEVPQD